MREKVGKSRNTVFFQWFVAPEGRKVGSLKRRVRSQLARGEDEKLHAVVARSTFPTQNVQNTPWSDHFWKLRCQKSARRCGAKQISKWKCTKTHQRRTTFGSWDVEKSARRCGAKHISKSKTYKAHHGQTTFGSWDVKKVHAVVARSTFRSQNAENTRDSDHFWKLGCQKKCTPFVARSTFRSQNVKNTRGSDHFWRFGCRFASFRFTALH